jgi:hypothetical protein
MPRARRDVTGQRFGRLEVLAEITAPGLSRNRRYLCRCDCGKHPRVCLKNLLSGSTRSCGCWNSESSGLRLRTYRAQYDLYLDGYK